jgi:hypothetical protein
LLYQNLSFWRLLSLAISLFEMPDGMVIINSINVEIMIRDSTKEMASIFQPNREGYIKEDTKFFILPTNVRNVHWCLYVVSVDRKQKLFNSILLILFLMNVTKISRLEWNKFVQLGVEVPIPIARSSL